MGNIRWMLSKKVLFFLKLGKDIKLSLLNTTSFTEYRVPGALHGIVNTSSDLVFLIILQGV